MLKLEFINKKGVKFLLSGENIAISDFELLKKYLKQNFEWDFIGYCHY